MYRICRKSIDIGKPVYFFLVCFSLLFGPPSFGQKKTSSKASVARSSNKRVIYGSASFYHEKFDGRRTASGEIFSSSKLTCACNMLPFGTWVKVINVRNGQSVVVKVNDRLHPNMRRIADLSPAAAKKLNYKAAGLIRVKVEVIGRKKPKK
ncbi:MAG: septal ring lytic transglycosylase RlpA family protein [Ferruginibacter sp.]|nr:septal ring lytic transglycosylase RlpA family protein [Ferruginibacter sp.]